MVVWYICGMGERKEGNSAQEYDALVDSLRTKVSRGIAVFGRRISPKEEGFDIVRIIHHSVVEKVRANEISEKPERYSFMETAAILSRVPELRVKRDKKGSIDIMLRVDTGRAGMKKGSFRVYYLIENRNIFGKSRLRYYEEIEETSDEGVFRNIPVVLDDEPSVNELKSFGRVLDYFFMKPDAKSIETASIILPQEDAYKVIEHLEGLGFEQNESLGVHCWGKDGYSLMHTFEDEDGRMVSVERFIDKTIIEMGEDLARYLANSGFSA